MQLPKHIKSTDHAGAEAAAVKRTTKMERQRAASFKRDLREAKKELSFKDQKLEESWVRIKEEVNDKR